MLRHSPALPDPRAGSRPAPTFRTRARYPLWPVLLASLVAASPVGAQSDGRIWGRVATTGGEVHEGFLRFHGEQDAASWTDTFRSVDDVPSERRDTWLAASRGGSPFIRTIELKGYRVSWNDRSDDFPSRRTLRVPFGSIGAIIVHGHNIEVALRSGPEGAADSTGYAGRDFRSGESVRFIGQQERHWEDTRIDVQHPLRGTARLSGDEVRRIEFAAAPDGQRAASPRIAGSVEDHSGRTFRGLVTWDNRAVLLSDTLAGRFEGSPRPTILFEEIRSIARKGRRAEVELESGEVVALVGGVGRRRDPAAEITVVDPDFGTVTIDWDEFSALRLGSDGSRAGGPADALAYGDFDAGAPLRGVVLTDDGEELEGSIRWNAVKSWSWDLLYAYSDDVYMAIELGNILTLEQTADPPPVPQAAPRLRTRGRARVTLLDGSTFEVTGNNDVGSGNLGILVKADSPRGDPDSSGAAAADSTRAGDAGRGGWRFVAWEDVREVRFEHAGGVDRGR